MPPPMPFRGPPIELFTVELLYVIVVVALCLAVYYKTKEIYDLT
ncbi:MAG: hypothetical protein QF486_00520 [Candidatus Woesearchaeota archaeon]|jgi:hypothetical protein|nr:hypothetical protein [Candidatus Woesearchaeota archaeon]MDP7181293.1 hypothetical protein [Candidatus Woesearchaeota archaeon]MDP7198088.1 hypothetical protein [Candidatus Woesearchaeota archaeon]MDP7466922.1 hypothetical protein [Candidatus Woesearchaeota archaeon]MDP7647357.1 hypothetical protein [Candidatus Woesearchaeota archaeon]